MVHPMSMNRILAPSPFSYPPFWCANIDSAYEYSYEVGADANVAAADAYVLYDAD